MSKPMDDYVEVSERIELFYGKYPEGSLRCRDIYPVQVGEDHFLVYIAQAFRTPDDQAPAEGVAWEPVPGKTNFTRDSEAMNAETSAWGRAIAALGFEVKRGIASKQEVMNRRNGDDAPTEQKRTPPSTKQIDFFGRLLKEKGCDGEQVNLLSWYAKENLSGNRGGSMSVAIDGLKDGDAEDTIKRLQEASEKWQRTLTDIPADTEGL